jgi:hypothetical protein
LEILEKAGQFAEAHLSERREVYESRKFQDADRLMEQGMKLQVFKPIPAAGQERPGGSEAGKTPADSDVPYQWREHNLVQ